MANRKLSCVQMKSDVEVQSWNKYTIHKHNLNSGQLILCVSEFSQKIIQLQYLFNGNKNTKAFHN